MKREVDRPKVALIGRPNVGKSTLYNRLIGVTARRGGRAAIVDELPGVTRDRLYGTCEWDGYEFTVIDCGGIGPESEDPLWEPVADNSRFAMNEADVIVFVTDARTGMTLSDEALLKELRRQKKPVIVAVNKVDSLRQEADAAEFWALGYTDLINVAAQSGRNMGNFLDLVISRIDWSGYPKATPAFAAYRYGGEVGGEGPEPDLSWKEAYLAEQARLDALEEAEEWEGEEDEEAADADSPGLEDEEPGDEDEDIDDQDDADEDISDEDLNDEDWDEDDEAEQAAEDARIAAGGKPAERTAEDYPFAWAGMETPTFTPDESWREQALRLVFVGRQNVGKSSMTNTLLGEWRSLVADLPGTTRDPLFARFERDGNAYEVLDTAGMKRISRLKEDVDFYSLIRAESSLRGSEVALLVLDAVDGITEQDKRVASKIEELGRAVIIVVNKADLIVLPEREKYAFEIEEEQQRHAAGERWAKDPLAGEGKRDRKSMAKRMMHRGHDASLLPQIDQNLQLAYLDYVRDGLGKLGWAPVVFTSALRDWGIDNMLAAAQKARENFHRRLDYSALRAVLREAVAMNPPPIVKNRELRFFDFRQIGNCPPTFLIELNSKRSLRQAYERYLGNTIRKHFDFTGTHIQLVIYEKRRKSHTH